LAYNVILSYKIVLLVTIFLRFVFDTVHTVLGLKEMQQRKHSQAQLGTLNWKKLV